MGFKLKAAQPEKRAVGVAAGAVAAGLYDGESIVELDDGSFVAVSVIPRWLPNGSGVDFAGVARAVDATGAGITDPLGQQIVTTFNFNAGALMVEELGVDAIAREVLLTLIGEPPELKRAVPVEGGKVQQVEAIGLSPEVKLQANVRKAAKLAAATGPKDPKKLLAAKSAANNGK